MILESKHVIYKSYNNATTLPFILPYLISTVSLYLDKSTVNRSVLQSSIGLNTYTAIVTLPASGKKRCGKIFQAYIDKIEKYSNRLMAKYKLINCENIALALATMGDSPQAYGYLIKFYL